MSSPENPPLIQESSGPSDVLGREEAIRLVREALDQHQPIDNDGRAVHAIIVLDRAMRRSA